MTKRQSEGDDGILHIYSSAERHYYFRTESSLRWTFQAEWKKECSLFEAKAGLLAGTYSHGMKRVDELATSKNDDTLRSTRRMRKAYPW